MAFDLEHLADLALFARVVEARSFTGAAELSGIAKSAVSRRISLLEQRLGVQLLRRTTRSLSVTTEGARLYEHCSRLLSSARAAEESVAGASTSLAGIVRINAPVTFSQMHLVRPLAEFLKKHPEVTVDLVTDDRLVDVVDSGFDVVVRISRLSDASFVARRLASDHLVVVGSPAYLETHGRPLRPEDLVHHNCLHYTLVAAAAEWRFRIAEAHVNLPVRGNLWASDGTVLRQAALSGLGLVVVPSFMVAEDVVSGQLEEVLTGARRAKIGIYAVVSKARGLPHRTKTLVDFLCRWFRSVDWATPV
jgi:DNA-binding transcriptional LysR family regulator